MAIFLLVVDAQAPSIDQSPRLRQINELSIGSARFISEQVERGLLVDLVSFHQDALRALGRRDVSDLRQG